MGKSSKDKTDRPRRPAVMGKDLLASLAAEVHESEEAPSATKKKATSKKKALADLKKEMPVTKQRDVPDFLRSIAAEVKDAPDHNEESTPHASSLFQQLAAEVKEGVTGRTDEVELPELYQQLSLEVKKEAMEQLARAEEAASRPPAPLLADDVADDVLDRLETLFHMASAKKAALQRGIPKVRGEKKTSLLKRFNKSLRLFRHLDERFTPKEVELAFVFVRKLLDRVDDGLYPEMVRGLDSLTDRDNEPLPFPENQMLLKDGVVVWDQVRREHVMGARNYLEIAISVLDGNPPSVRLDTLGFSDEELQELFAALVVLPHAHNERFAELKTIGDPVFAADVNRLRDSFLERPENRFVTVARLLQASLRASADDDRDQESRDLALRILNEDVERFRELGSLDDIVSCLPQEDQALVESMI